MSYYLNLFSVETWKKFQETGCTVTGFSRAQRSQAVKNIGVDDVMLCYVVKLSRWIGALRVCSEAYVDESPIFRPFDDPFVVRFNVEPIITLDFENAVPATLPDVWQNFSWTKDIEPGSVGWGANFQRSLRPILEPDGSFIMNLLEQQKVKPERFELSSQDLRALKGATTVKTEAGDLVVAIPTDETGLDEKTAISNDQLDVRESHVVQGLIAEIGIKMGFKIWLPKADRERVLRANTAITSDKILDQLPMNYNEATVRTIEQIDVLWLYGRSIARAFEVEHTTAIYSGLLRMADLLALQPNIQIPLHIVAPEERRGTVLEQIRRPIFSLLETGPLTTRCSLITYDSIRELSELPHLQHLNHTVIEEFEAFTEF